ncbi:MAG: protein-L-isoaspartate(D-aspartate) O-methyltransferase [Nitrospirae bacterium]|nr:protein-L-isoaspartate(D-aspartate) O-methyltransferase [Nitrospirota bacterium]NTW66156.1 protein-L-isoaspartate(D-aspartate) O-methyltransferase [Nitrospirota bacterium]
MDFEKERSRMVEEQIAFRGVTDPRVLAVMGKVPRHEFMPEALRAQAYGDHAMPIGEGQTISQPYIVALMTELLELKGDERVLEIGTGSGYQAAVLAELCQKVFTIERVKTLADKARATLDRLGYKNVVMKVYDGTYGWKEMSPFDAIIVTAAAPDVPDTLVEQLKDGGRLVIPVGERYSQLLLKIIKSPSGTVTKTSIPCIFVPLIGAKGWRE